jgi:hypothetical protein
MATESRKEAISWWNNLTYQQQVEHALATSHLRDHHLMPVTGREIEQIYSFNNN